MCGETPAGRQAAAFSRVTTRKFLRLRCTPLPRPSASSTRGRRGLCVCVFLYFLTRCPRGQQRFSKESPSRPQLTGSQTGAPFSPSPPQTAPPDKGNENKVLRKRQRKRAPIQKALYHHGNTADPSPPLEDWQ